MTSAFIALKPSRPFIARITFQSVRILQIICCPFGMFNTVVVFREKKLSYGLCVAERREQVSVILSLVALAIARFTLFI